MLVDFIEHRRTLSRRWPGRAEHARRRFPIFLITASGNALWRERDVVCDNHRRVTTPTSSPRCPLQTGPRPGGPTRMFDDLDNAGKPRMTTTAGGVISQLSRRRSRPVLPGRIDARPRRCAAAASCVPSAWSSPCRTVEKFGIWGGCPSRERRCDRRQRAQAARKCARRPKAHRRPARVAWPHDRFDIGGPEAIIVL